MKKKSSYSVLLVSATFILFCCCSSFCEASLKGVDGSSEKGIPSFVYSNIGKSEINQNKDVDKAKSDSMPLVTDSSSNTTSEEVICDISNHSIREDKLCFDKKDGIASWYGKDYQGKITASGEPFNMYDMTAAHKTLPFGTKVEVIDCLKGLSVTVRINDRGPYIHGRVINLSRLAAEKIDLISDGITPVKIRIVEVAS